MIEQRDRAHVPAPAPFSMDPRAELAAEWHAVAVRTDDPDDVLTFYQHATGLGADLDAWHTSPLRQDWTRMLVHVAREAGVGSVIDIGCGAGHDLMALRRALPSVHLYGVEPNHGLRESIGPATRIIRAERAEEVPVEKADLLICIDVLEHVVGPETFLGDIAQRAPVGCLLIEATATHDAGTPLHLRENAGWRPGRVLERHGWEVVDRSDRLHVWRRTAAEGRQRASVLLCAHRSVNAEVLTALLHVTAANVPDWRLQVKTGDALIARSRAIVVTRWWRETNDDVFLMVDDDIVFSPQDADRLAELCRTGYDIVCGAYPVHDGGHMACRFFPGAGVVSFGPGQPLMEIEYAATGFMAVHRRVIDALIPTLPLCHADQSWSFHPLFQTQVVEHPTSGHEWISEDWGFCRTARAAGFRVWLDPQTILKHLGSAAISVRNMAAMHQALQQV